MPVFGMFFFVGCFYSHMVVIDENIGTNKQRRRMKTSHTHTHTKKEFGFLVFKIKIKNRLFHYDDDMIVVC